jgi:protein TonB
MLPSSSSKALILGVAVSLTAHILTAVVLESARRAGDEDKKRHKPGMVQVKVKPVEVKPPPPPPPPPPPEAPKPKVQPKPPQPVANKSKPQAAPMDPVKPVQGLTKESLAKDGKGGFSAPVGNTLMAEDDGTRVTDAAPLNADLSSDPKLIADTVVIPSYTDAALDAGFEGRVTVEVYVDESGAVVQAEPVKKIGYGMDDRILQSAMSAKFIPRKNRLGQPEPSWTKITFNLQVP